ncbi:MAG TPA: hypothetical protein VGC55_01810 [Dokdonella sp.]
MSEPAAQALPAYRVHDGDPAGDGDAVVAIWRGNLGQEGELARKYDWFYRRCPLGAPMLKLLRHEPSESWAGVAAIGRRRMLWQGREIRAGVLVDMAVAPQHRSLGPALLLQRSVLESGIERFDLLYGFPNRKAEAAVRRCGYSKLGDIVRYVRVLRYASYLQRKMSALAARPLGWLLDSADRLVDAWRGRAEAPLVAQWSDRVDPRMDELWNRSQHGGDLLAVRDAALLRWRFDEALVSFRYLMLSESLGGPLLAWFACQASGSMLQISDFWSIDSAEGIATAMVAAMLRTARKEGYSAVSFQYAGPAARVRGWLAARFVERGRRPIYGKWREAPPSGAALDLHLTAIDEDE